MLEHEKNGTYSKDFMQGAIWSIKQRTKAADQRRQAQSKSPAVDREDPDPWGAVLHKWDELGAQLTEGPSCQDCKASMHSPPAERSQPTKHSTEADLVPAKPNSSRFSWLLDARTSAIEAWYQELQALYHGGDFIGMELHLEDCVQDVDTGTCRFVPSWMETAFSWTAWTTMVMASGWILDGLTFGQLGLLTAFLQREQGDPVSGALRAVNHLYSDAVAFAMCTLHLVEPWRRWTLGCCWVGDLLCRRFLRPRLAASLPPPLPTQLFTHYGLMTLLGFCGLHGPIMFVATLVVAILAVWNSGRSHPLEDAGDDDSLFDGCKWLSPGICTPALLAAKLRIALMVVRCFWQVWHLRSALEIMFFASSAWVPQMTSRLLMKGCLALITLVPMLMRWGTPLLPCCNPCQMLSNVHKGIVITEYDKWHLDHQHAPTFGILLYSMSEGIARLLPWRRFGITVPAAQGPTTWSFEGMGLLFQQIYIWTRHIIFHIILDLPAALVYLATGTLFSILVAGTYMIGTVMGLPDALSWMFERTAWLWQPACIFGIWCVDLVPWGKLRLHLTAARSVCWTWIKQAATAVSYNMTSISLHIQGWVEATLLQIMEAFTYQPPESQKAPQQGGRHAQKPSKAAKSVPASSKQASDQGAASSRPASAQLSSTDTPAQRPRSGRRKKPSGDRGRDRKMRSTSPAPDAGNELDRASSIGSSNGWGMPDLPLHRPARAKALGPASCTSFDTQGSVASSAGPLHDAPLSDEYQQQMLGSEKALQGDGHSSQQPVAASDDVRSTSAGQSLSETAEQDGSNAHPQPPPGQAPAMHFVSSPAADHRQHLMAEQEPVHEQKDECGGIKPGRQGLVPEAAAGLRSHSHAATDGSRLHDAETSAALQLARPGSSSSNKGRKRRGAKQKALKAALQAEHGGQATTKTIAGPTSGSQGCFAFVDGISDGHAEPWKGPETIKNVAAGQHQAQRKMVQQRGHPDLKLVQAHLTPEMFSRNHQQVVQFSKMDSRPHAASLQGSGTQERAITEASAQRRLIGPGGVAEGQAPGQANPSCTSSSPLENPFLAASEPLETNNTPGPTGHSVVPMPAVPAAIVDESRGGSADDMQGLCMSCETLPRQTLFAPCGHIVFCGTCAQQWQNVCQQQHRPLTCPWCRVQVVSVVDKIFMP
ncbi:hypothetical protein WJX74_008508 [Apatococcus lobatus]|uniref:RING-type domain-containing protein n=1 Tax=Apatococcus lobatus TaxID=904363 RepID=A0AAW1S783_9CHLO